MWKNVIAMRGDSCWRFDEVYMKIFLSWIWRVVKKLKNGKAGMQIKTLLYSIVWLHNGMKPLCRKIQWYKRGKYLILLLINHVWLDGMKTNTENLAHSDSSAIKVDSGSKHLYPSLLRIIAWVTYVLDSGALYWLLYFIILV